MIAMANPSKDVLLEGYLMKKKRDDKKGLSLVRDVAVPVCTS